MNKFSLLFIALFLLTVSACNKDDNDDNNTACSSTTSVFSIALSTTGCNVNIQQSLGTTSAYSESISGNTRNVSINGVANHNVGQFPNSGNPNTIAAVTENFSMTTNPQQAASKTYAQGYTTALLFSGVAVEPYTAEFFMTSSGPNTNWNITTLQSTTNLGLDCNNAHVQPNGRYHYHGTPNAYLSNLSANGTQMVKVGYAADGYPLYYKYGYNDAGTAIIALESGYRLKTTERGGDGVSAPNGCPDGYYFQDYEYVSGVSSLDECNGRFGKTPDAPAGEYYYVITDNFPSAPICFSGTPNASFHH